MSRTGADMIGNMLARIQPWPLGLVLVLSAPDAVRGAGVVLRSDIFLKVCRIEVSKGANRGGPNNRIVFSGAIEKGWSYQTHDRDYLCYRRSTDPMDCWSSLSEYRCMSWSVDGQISLPVQ